MNTHKFDDYTMTLEDSGRVDSMGKVIVRYTFTDPNGVELFKGEDLHCSPMNDPESIETARTLLNFLTCQPGDVDSEYFDNYTPVQMEFATSYECESLQLYVFEDEEE